MTCVNRYWSIVQGMSGDRSWQAPRMGQWHIHIRADEHVRSYSKSWSSLRQLATELWQTMYQTWMTLEEDWVLYLNGPGSDMRGTYQTNREDGTKIRWPNLSINLLYAECVSMFRPPREEWIMDSAKTLSRYNLGGLRHHLWDLMRMPSRYKGLRMWTLSMANSGKCIPNLHFL